MGQVKVLTFCILLVFLIKINAEEFSKLLGSASQNNSYTLYGKVEAGNLTFICAGAAFDSSGINELEWSFSSISCVSMEDCNEQSTCFQTPDIPKCQERLSVGSQTTCPSSLEGSSAHSQCLFINRPDYDGSLKEKLYFDRFVCKIAGAVPYYFDHYAALFNRDPDTLLREDLELKFFHGGSALRAHSNQTQVVSLFANEAFFIQCRVPKGSYQKPSKSPLTVRHRNGSFIDIGPEPDKCENSQYWTFSYNKFIVGKEMVGILCSAVKIDSEDVADRRMIGLNVTETPPVLDNDDNEVEPGVLYHCQLSNLLLHQKQIFFQTVQERGVYISKNWFVNSFNDYQRMKDLSQGEMNVTIECWSPDVQDSRIVNFYVRFEKTIPPLINKPNNNARELTHRGSKEIRCDFTGRPIPSVMWLQNGQILQFSWGQLNNNDSITARRLPYYSTLDLPPFPQNSSGLSYADLYPNFSCVASNSHGTDRRDFITGSAPKIQSSASVKKIIFTWRKEEHETTVSMTCLFQGGPTTTVRWLQDGLTMNNSVRKNTEDALLESSVLNITIDLRAVEGRTVREKYVCIVYNEFGNDTLEFLIFGKLKDEEWDDILFLLAVGSLLLVVWLLVLLAAILLYKSKTSQPMARATDDQKTQVTTKMEELETFLPSAPFTPTSSIYPVLTKEMGD